MEEWDDFETNPISMVDTTKTPSTEVSANPSAPILGSPTKLSANARGENPVAPLHVPDYRRGASIHLGSTPSHGFDPNKKMYVGPTGLIEEFDDMRSAPQPSVVASPNRAAVPRISDRDKQTQRKLLKGFARVEGWLNPEAITNLRDEIETDFRRRVEEARLIGNNYQVGFDKTRLRAEVTMEHLGRYFGASTDELLEGRKVPQWAQDRVNDLMELPGSELEQLAKNLAAERGRDAANIDTYITRLSARELARQNKDIQLEINYVVGRDKRKLSLPAVRNQITKITQRRAEESYFKHRLEARYKQKIHRKDWSFTPDQIQHLAEATINDMRSFERTRYEERMRNEAVDTPNQTNHDRAPRQRGVRPPLRTSSQAPNKTSRKKNY
jgi:hypothetical protein